MMNRNLEEVGLSCDAEYANIGKLLREQVVVLEREFYDLKAKLRDIANRNSDIKLIDWLSLLQSKFEKKLSKRKRALAKLEDIKMKNTPSENYAEAIERLEHIEEISKLTRQQIELHIQFMLKTNARLKEKIIEAQNGRR